MRRLLVLAVVVVSALMSSPAAFADRVPVADLLADGASFEGEVTITGEMVGDYGYRGDGWVWGQVNEDRYATEPLLEGGPVTGGNVGVGVRMPRSLADQLGPPGGYRRLGPLVELTGQWIYHDAGRGGESYLEVASIVIVNEGRDLAEAPHWWRLASGGALLTAAGGMWLIRKRKP